MNGDPGVPVHVDVVGSGPETLVLLHGFTGSGAVWAPLTRALATRRRLLLVDLPGHGRSAAPPAGAGIEAVTDALVAAVAAHGAPRAAWLGYSLGGRIALHAALRHPGAVERLVLESTSPGIANAAARAERAAADDALAEALMRDGIEAFVDRWLAQPLFATQAALAPAQRDAERARRCAQSPAALAAALRACSVGRQACLLDRLPPLAAPVLLVVGALDAAYRAHAAAMAARLAHARLAVVPGAGHDTHLERPAAFLAAVAPFLDAAPLAA